MSSLQELKSPLQVQKESDADPQNQPPAGWRERLYARFGKQNVLVLVALISLVLSRSIDSTLYVRLANKYTNYTWYLGTVILPIAFLVISWPVVWYKMMFTQDITPEMRAFSHKKYAIMGLFDTLSNLFGTWSAPYLKLPLQNVLMQLVLPANMLASLIFLRTRYKASHYLGAILIIYGVMVKMLPGIFLSDASFFLTEHPTFWLILFIISVIPNCASNVYKEIGLKDSESDVWYMNAWIGVYQLIFGLLTAWTVALPWPEPAPVIQFSEFGQYINDANSCFFGSNARPTDQSCDGTMVVFLFFIVFNIMYNQLMLYVFKRGSSVLFVIASAARLPFVDLWATIPFIAGEARQAVDVYDFYALFMLITGIVVYYWQKEEIAPPETKDKDVLLRSSENPLQEA